MTNFSISRFDGDGNPHYRHLDWQGSVTMTTDRKGKIEQHTGYYPYDEPSGQPYLYGGKERLRDLAINDYDFSARRLNSALGIFITPDPLAFDSGSTNPYLYCAANPIKYIDPSGCEIQGVHKSDTKMLIKDFHDIFRDDVFSEFRKLIVRSGKKQNGKSLAPISDEAKNAAFAGKTLTEDQQALVDLFVNTVNSKDVHKIEYHGDSEVVSKQAENAFLPRFMEGKIGPHMNEILAASHGLPMLLLVNEGGAGTTTFTKNGTYSIIFLEGQHKNGRAVTTGHEALGHGRSLAIGRGHENQHVDAIRTENLILRVMGIPFINDGSEHDKEKGAISNPSLLPDYR